MNLEIEIKNLNKIYASADSTSTKNALTDFNLQVKEGSIFGLLGPNGAGKSTMINILAGTVVKSSGEAFINGIDTEKFPKKARGMIGIVPQEVVYDTFFPIGKSLELTAGYYGVHPEQRRTKEILTALGLMDKKDVMPAKLSGGMKRRFLIAKAMVHSPKILILDEPTAGVDIELRSQLWAYVKELNAQGVTIIITTHYLEEAEELCDEIAFINHGRNIKQDSKKNLLDELGSRYLEIEFDHDIDFLSNKINEHHKWQIVNDQLIRIELEPGNNDFSKILKKINALDADIKNIKTFEPELEDVFYKFVH
jgi:ABC-2 type transport system ATP-binding protein